MLKKFNKNVNGIGLADVPPDVREQFALTFSVCQRLMIGNAEWMRLHEMWVSNVQRIVIVQAFLSALEDSFFFAKNM